MAKAFYAFTFFGIGEVFSGITMSIIIDKYGSKKSCIFNIIAMILTTICTLLTILKNKYNYLTFITCFLWGVVDGFANIHTL